MLWAAPCRLAAVWQPPALLHQGGPHAPPAERRMRSGAGAGGRSQSVAVNPAATAVAVSTPGSEGGAGVGGRPRPVGIAFEAAAAVHYRETSLVTRLVTSKVLVIGARNGFARNDLVTTS